VRRKKAQIILHCYSQFQADFDISRLYQKLQQKTFELKKDTVCVKLALKLL